MRRSKKIFCFLAVLLWMFLVTGCTEKTEEQISFEQVDEDEKSQESGEKKEDTAADIIYVDVCGQVQHPGVYELLPDSRIYQAIEAAGGMTEDAAADSINQAQKLQDGQQIYVPSKEEAASGTFGTGTNAAAGMQDDGKVSLNTAAKEELMTLPGIGEVKAEAIISYREEKGGFQSIEELKEIEGIKEGVFQKVKDQIRI